jgi:two-component system, sensor histidine kinase and response regulator
VRVACNGRRALEAIQEETFAVVLMDVQMPEMGGFEATAAIREKERITGGHIPIIAMTAHAVKGDRERCIGAGMDEYVSKPIQAAELFSAIEGLTLLESPKTGPCSLPTVKEVFDRSGILARLDNNTDLLRELVSVFLEESARLEGQIENAIAERDPQKLERAAHSLRGTTSHFGAGTACRTALELEMMGRNGNLTAAQDVFVKLSGEMAGFKSELVALVSAA